MSTKLRHRLLGFNRLGMLLVALTAATASLAAALLDVAEPASAAFPGPNGRIAFASNLDGDIEIYSMNAGGSGLRSLTDHPAIDTQPAVSPDGRTIAFASNRTGDFEIYTMDADNGGDLRRRTDNPADQTNPAFAPDGETIAIESDAGFGDADIYLLDGTPGGVLLTDDSRDPNPPDDQRPAFSPNGQRIAFETNRNGDDDIYTMDADDGGNLEQLTGAPQVERDPNWSPDSERIVFSRWGPGIASIVVMDDNGSNQRRLTNRKGQPPTSDYEPAFSPDGTRIALVSNRAGLFDIYTMRSGDGSDVIRSTDSSGSDTDPDWGRDPCTITGSNGSEVLNGTPGADLICGLGGDDRIRGFDGDDEIRGGGGNDIVYGGTGDDHVFGEDGDDIVNTQDTVQGNDLADGGQGAADSCRTDPGDQTVRCP
jgi:Tol biopolymer transport system component